MQIVATMNFLDDRHPVGIGHIVNDNEVVYLKDGLALCYIGMAEQLH